MSICWDSSCLGLFPSCAWISVSFFRLGKLLTLISFLSPFFLAAPCSLWAVSSLTSDWTWTCRSEKHGFPTTGLPGNSRNFFRYISFLFRVFLGFPVRCGLGCFVLPKSLIYCFHCFHLSFCLLFWLLIFFSLSSRSVISSALSSLLFIAFISAFVLTSDFSHFSPLYSF